MDTGVKSNVNRRMIVDTLYESLVGSNMSINLHANRDFNYYLNECINTIHQNRFHYNNNLMEMNKKILLECYNFIRQQYMNKSLSNYEKNSIEVESDVDILTRENRRLYEERQKEREIKKEKKEIDFSLEIDDDQPSVENLL